MTKNNNPRRKPRSLLQILALQFFGGFIVMILVTTMLGAGNPLWYPVGSTLIISVASAIAGFTAKRISAFFLWTTGMGLGLLPVFGDVFSVGEEFLFFIPFMVLVLGVPPVFFLGLLGRKLLDKHRGDIR